MSDLPVPSQDPAAAYDQTTVPQILPEPCKNMPLTAVASKFFPGPIAPVLCGDLNFIYQPDATPGGHDAHVGINIVPPDVPSRNLDVGGDPTLGFPSRVRGSIEDSGRRGGMFYSVAAYNAANDGVTDATQAVLACVAAAIADHGGTTLLRKGVGATIYFPPGTYLITSPIISTIPMMFVGAGAGISVLLLGRNPVGPSFGEIAIVPTVTRVLPEDSLFVNCGAEGLTFVAVDPLDGNNGITFNVNGASNSPLPGARIINCNFNALQVAVALIDTSLFKMSGCHFRSQTTGDVVISNPTYPDAGDSCITDCTFDNKLNELAAIRHTSSGGLRIENNKFNGDTPFGQGPQFHYLNECDVPAPGTSVLEIVGNSFENFDVAAIAIAPRAGAAYNSINIVGNQFAVRNVGSGIVLDATRAGSVIDQVNVTSNIFVGDDSQVTGPNGVTATATAGAITGLAFNTNIFGSAIRPLLNGTVLNTGTVNVVVFNANVFFSTVQVSAAIGNGVYSVSGNDPSFGQSFLIQDGSGFSGVFFDRSSADVARPGEFYPAGGTPVALGAAGGFGWGSLYLDFVNTVTVGNVTINAPSGRVNVAAAASAITVTNNLCKADSHVFAQCATNDATAVVKNVVPGVGSFVINLVAATAQTAINFFIVSAS